MKRLYKNIIGMVLFSRFLIFITVLIGSSITLNPNVPNVPGANVKINIPVANLLVRWDSIYYFNMTINGLDWFRSATILSSNIECWAFRPFFPIILASLRLPIVWLGDYESCLLTALWWNIIAFLLAATYFYKLTKVIYDQRIANLATLFLCISPATVFFVAPYPESTYLLLITASFFYLEKNKTQLSALLSFLAGFTRPEGILTSILFGLKALAAKERKRVTLLLCSFFVLLPLPIYMLFSYIMTNNFYMPIYKETIWPKMRLADLLSDIMLGGHKYNIAFSIIPFITLVIIALCLISYFLNSCGKKSQISKIDFHLKEKQTPYFIYTVLLVIFFLYAADFNSFTRYVSLLLPIYWATSIWASKNVMRIFILASIYVSLMIIGTLLYVNWYPFI